LSSISATTGSIPVTSFISDKSNTSTKKPSDLSLTTASTKRSISQPNGAARPIITSSTAITVKPANGYTTPVKLPKAANARQTNKSTGVSKSITPAIAKTVTTSTVNSTASTNAGPVTAPASGYRALLEKAQAAQNLRPVGTITDVKSSKEKLSRRSMREARAKQDMSVVKGSKEKGGMKSGPNAKLKSNTAGQVGVSKRRPVDETGYKGTMRPSAPIRPVIGSKGNAPQRSRKYNDNDEIDDYDRDDDMIDDEDDYDSAGSSDMEAGFDEIIEEETISTKVAKQEDERERREEENLKLQKLKRKAGVAMSPIAPPRKREKY